MVYWNQLAGDNIEVSGSDLAGEPKSPTYNSKLGFADGNFYLYLLDVIELISFFH